MKKTRKNSIKTLNKITILVIVFVFFTILLHGCKTNNNFTYKNQNKSVLLATKSNSTNNEYSLKDINRRNKKYRNVEYIGGTKIFLDREYPLTSDEMKYTGNRWYSFYRDINTGEILRGLEKYNFFTAGLP